MTKIHNWLLRASLLLLICSFFPSVFGQNIIPDPSFESGSVWSLQDSASSLSSSAARTGSKSLQLINDGSKTNHNAIQSNIQGVIPGKEYVYSVWVRGDSVAGVGAGGKPLAILRWKNSAGQSIKEEMYMWASYGTYTWSNMQIYLQAPSDAQKVDVSFRSWWDCLSGKTYWDDIELSERNLPTGSLLGTYQAENSQARWGGNLGTNALDYTGTGFFDATTNNAYIEWTGIPGVGERVLSFRYAIEGGPQPFELKVNGVSQGRISPMIATGRRGSWASNIWQVNLPSATNTIRLTIGSAGGLGSPLIDKLDVYAPKSNGGTNPSTAITWNRWENTLTSTKTYNNPYLDVSVAVTYTGPNGESITGTGFWDGNNAFMIRNMFPKTGVWTWKTTCSDTTNTGLHNQQGTVTVSSYQGSNTLYQKGYLKISPDKRYLTYNDNTPFLWLGDTPWSALIGASQSEWESYVQKRKSQHFNVLQIHSRDGWISRTTDRDGNPPFLGTGTTLRWNPLYWHGVDNKIKYANDQGMIVFFAAVRQPGPGVSDKDTAQVKAFARNLAGRMMGSFVVYSPIADDNYTIYADESGNQIQASTSVHLVTAHPRFQWVPAETFFGKSYIDFAGIQSGAGWRYDPYTPGSKKIPFSAPLAVQQAIDWPLALYRKTPTKPVLNLEIPYDAKSLQIGESATYEQPYPVRLPRSTSYLSMLNGAKGITYGVFGVWNWGVDVGWGGSTFTFSEALSQPSGDQMKYLYDLFSEVDWWLLVPRPELIADQQTDWLKKTALSITPDGREGVAYIQDTASMTITMTGFSGTMKARWYNPMTGLWVSGPSSVANSGTSVFTKPSGWQDAVLVLEYSGTSPTPTCSSTGGRCCATGTKCSTTTQAYNDCQVCCPSTGSCVTIPQTCSSTGGRCCATGTQCSTATQAYNDCQVCCPSTGSCVTIPQTCSSTGGRCCATGTQCSTATQAYNDCQACCPSTGTCMIIPQTCSSTGGRCCATGTQCSTTTQAYNDCQACCPSTGTCMIIPQTCSSTGGRCCATGTQCSTATQAYNDCQACCPSTGTCMIIPQTCSSTGGRCCATGTQCSTATQVYSDCQACCPSTGTCANIQAGNDEIAIYSLDQSSGNSATDSSGNAYHGTITGATWVVGRKGNALSFDGNDDRVDLGNMQVLAGSSGLTISAWFNPRVIPTGTNNLDAVIWQHDSWDNFVGMRFDSNAQGFYGSIRKNGAMCSAGIPYSTLATNRWHHVVFIFDKGTGKIFLNGALNGSCNNSASFTSAPDLSNNMYLGTLNLEANHYFNGVVDEVRIFNRVLTAAEVLELSKVRSSPCGNLDADDDGKINLVEIMDLVNSWRQGETNIDTLMQTLGKWKNGC